MFNEDSSQWYEVEFSNSASAIDVKASQKRLVEIAEVFIGQFIDVAEHGYTDIPEKYRLFFRTNSTDLIESIRREFVFQPINILPEYEYLFSRSV